CIKAIKGKKEIMIPATKTPFAKEEIFWAESTLYEDLTESVNTARPRGINLGDATNTPSGGMEIDPVTPKRILLRRDILLDGRTVYGF
ncbi:hypothetical protein TorRG33x02_175570, partial [Trema orientale]